MLLLDTHALYWFIRGDADMPLLSRNAIADPETTVLVSAATFWELAIKHSKGKWPSATDVLANSDEIFGRLGFVELPITIAHARAAAALKGPHKDPFDRVLIAQAMLEGATIVSSDDRFPEYGVPVLWA